MTDEKSTDNKDKKLSLGSKLTLKAPIKANPDKLKFGSKSSVQVVTKKRKFSKDNKSTDAIDQGGLTDSERTARLSALLTASEKKETTPKPVLKPSSKPAPIPKVEVKEEEVVEKEDKKIKTEEKTSDIRAIKSNEKLITTPEQNINFSKKIDEKSAEEKEKEQPKKAKKGELKRRDKMTLSRAISLAENDGEDTRAPSLASIKRKRQKQKGTDIQEQEKKVRDVIVPETITVQELANRMAERTVNVTKALMKLGMMVRASETIDADTAELVISEFGHKIKRVTEGDVENILAELEVSSSEGDLKQRAPIVTIMGHVDHGKTSLLDTIRKSDVTKGEAGGITQHIGAYQVKTEAGNEITFIDTPGHEAFTAMRARGAKVTDLVVLVVAADDGIMAQTIEAIHHAQAAEVPLIIAINKIDKPEANPQKVRSELLEHHIVLEEFGGDVMSVEVSAKQATNIDKLLETILLQSEVMELNSNNECDAIGYVVESKVEKGKGIVSTFLVQKGNLKKGDIILAGTAYGKIRALTNDSGRSVKEAGPSMPVEITGLDESPAAGEKFYVLSTEKQAREICEYRKKLSKDLKEIASKKGTLEDLFLQSTNGGKKQLPVIIKADVHGSADAIEGLLAKISEENEDVGVKVLHSAVGGITSSDTTLASASNAIILGFNVRANNEAKALAETESVDIRYYSVIYDLVNEVKLLMGGLLDPIIKEKYLGKAEIRQVFSVPKIGKVAGCYVTDGIIKRGAGVRLLRDNVVIHEGSLKTLKRFKDDVKEVGSNFECGMAFENYDDIKERDFIEAFERVEEKQEIK